jgi:hypothetical protein
MIKEVEKRFAEREQNFMRDPSSELHGVVNESSDSHSVSEKEYDFNLKSSDSSAPRIQTKRLQDGLDSKYFMPSQERYDMPKVLF